MPFVAFGDWMPDVAALGNPGTSKAVNCVPGPNSYQPIGRLAPSTGALPARPRGAISGKDSNGDVHQYAGTGAALYRLVGPTWTDSSKEGGYSTDPEERWEFVRWKNSVIATNFSDPIQSIEMGGTDFDDLTDFSARHIAVVRDHVFAGNTSDPEDGAVPDRLRWSAFNNSDDWVVSPSTGADYRDLNKGAIMGVVGGEFGVILTRESVFRATWVGAPLWFQIDETVPGIGCVASGSVAQLGDTVYFLSEHGFVSVSNGTGLTLIGAGKVDRFVRDQIDQANMHRISSAVDRRGGRIAWAFPGVENVSGRPNRIVIYDAKFDRWSLIEQDVELLWRSAAQGSTLEQLDAISASLDALPASLDSPRWQGGSPQFSAFDAEFRSGNFDGPPMTAVIETKEAELHEGHRAQLNALRAGVDGGSTTLQVGARSRLSDPVTWGPVLSERASGRFTVRSNARYHRVRATISGTWTDALGVHVDVADVRRGNRRG
jgi:hypothetical protein